MIKYTILYKNGKTWNGKATHLRNILCVDCHIMVATYPYMTNSVRTDVLVPAELLPSCLGWVLKHFSIKKVRQPNPKSKTKKQKAFDEAYAKWVHDMGELNDGKRGNLDFSVKAYKKWLFQQKSSPAIKCFPSFSVGDKIGYYPQGSDELTWCTITEAGYTSPNNIKITAVLPGDISEVDTQIKLSYGEPDKDGFIPWRGGECPVPKGTMAHVKYRDGEEAICTVSLLDTDAGFKRIGEGGRVATNWYILPGFSFDEDIIAYKLYEEETSPNEPQKITFASGATISFEQPIETPVDIKINWEGVYKPWKESAIERLHKQVDEHWKFMDKVVGILDNKPIKTTYSFWLGAFGEVADV